MGHWAFASLTTALLLGNLLPAAAATSLASTASSLHVTRSEKVVYWNLMQHQGGVFQLLTKGVEHSAYRTRRGRWQDVCTNHYRPPHANGGLCLHQSSHSPLC
jgi:hypothetical protein